MTVSHIDYDQKVQSALRQVVRSILEDTAQNGLPGDHHFYVAFRTQAEGVDIPAHLRARFPEEMTIVLQHKFWGLKVEGDHFQIGLSFNRKPEFLTIPFAAITGFVDPSVQFALQFQDDTSEDETARDNEPGIDHDSVHPHVFVADTHAESANSDKTDKDGAFKDGSESLPLSPEQMPSASADTAPSAASKAKKPARADESNTAPDPSANVVTLDAFRKK